MGGKLTVDCTEFRELRRSTLVGFANVTVAELKLEIRNKDDAGKVVYTPVLSFASRAVADAFSAVVIEAVLKLDPEVFEREVAP